ncbi:MAG: Holliday junction branch migration protein RuvA [Pseudomonadota bacterium]
MIGYLQGKLLKREEDRILLLVNQIGYEILIPAVVMETLTSRKVGDEISLYIYYQQTERQPKPVLIGFNLEAEREFFQHFVSVEDIGPQKAIKALNVPIRDIARAIEGKDTETLERLKGIGKRTAQKIVATLSGKMEKFALIRKPDKEISPAEEDYLKQVLDVLVGQLGHRQAEAKRMIADALKRNPFASTPEELFEEVYRSEIAK